MATETLLDLIQDILSDMNSDEVNSIDDTVESLQAASILKDTYFYLLEEHERFWTRTLTVLESATTAFPTRMRLPDNVSEIGWIKYDRQTASATAVDIDKIKYLDPSDFLDRLYRRNEDDSNVETYTDSNNVKYLIVNDAAPSYWTTFDDEYIIFDSYDTAVESNLQSHKSVIFAFVTPTWTMSNTFTPDLPDHMFPLFKSMGRAACFEKIKQVTSGTDERRARKLTTRMQMRQRRIDGKPTGPDYGRK
jgi:hypothetical protein